MSDNNISHPEPATHWTERPDHSATPEHRLVAVAATLEFEADQLERQAKILRSTASVLNETIDEVKRIGIGGKR